LYHKDLVIEFVPTVPANGWWGKLKNKMLQAKNPDSRNRFYADWAKRNARTAGPNSIYVLICKEPAPLRVEVAMGRDVRQPDVFTSADVRHFQERLQALFQNGHYDEGLAEAVQSVRKTLQANRERVAVPAEPFPWAGIGSLVLILVGLWVCLQ